VFSALKSSVTRWIDTHAQQSETEILRIWAPLLEAGLTVTESIQLLAETTAHRATARGFSALKQGLASGLTLGGALRHSSLPLSSGVIASLESAESSGRLADMVHLTSTRLNQIDTMRRKAWSAARYPLIVGGLALIIITGLIIGIVPRFQHLYDRMGADLPVTTEILIELSNLLRTHGGVAMFTTLIFSVGAWYTCQTQAVQRLLDRLLNSLPVIGGFRRDLQTHHLTTQMDVLTRSGVGLDRALCIVSRIIQSPDMSDALHQAAQQIQRGHRTESIFKTLAIDPQSKQLWALGVRSGRLTHFLSIAHHNLNARLSTQLETLTGVLEPLLMALLGILTGGVMMALYEPVFSLGDAL
jgi:type IV pilus assembly protein PilC